MTRKNWTFFAAALAVTFLSVPSSAQAKSLLDILFGEKEPEEAQQGPPPEVTLEAPFGDAKEHDADKALESQKGKEIMAIYDTTKRSSEESSVEMDKPHRNAQQIAEWTTGVVADCLTMNPDDWDEDMDKLSLKFTPFAYQEFQDYLVTVGIQDTLTKNSMRMQAIAKEPGSVLKEGAINGSYHWLVEIPLMTTFYDKDIQMIDKNKDSQSQEVIVQVQVGRIRQATLEDMGIGIERWRVSKAE